MAPFEWDSNKEEENIRKHGVDFTIASQLWDGQVFERTDDRHNYGEVRFLAFGEIEGRVLAVVFTWRGMTRRIISARKANPRERALFNEEARRRTGAPPN
jgi:uncharacterized DUF497 family protein